MKLSVVIPVFNESSTIEHLIEMVRDPIDLIYSWHMRGWGGRYTKDPRVGLLTYESDHGIAPWFNLFIEGEYNELCPMDRIIHLIEGNTISTYEKYQKLSTNKKKQILWIFFEDFVTNTEKNIASIENFLHVYRTNRTSKQLKKERCPRVINDEDREKKYETIKSNSSKESFKKLENLYHYYNLIKENIINKNSDD